MPRTSRHCNRLPAARRFQPARGTVPAFIASAAVKPRAGMADAEAIRQMAEDFRNSCHREGGVSETDLEVLGFTRSQVKTLVPAARQRAQALSGAGI